MCGTCAKNCACAVMVVRSKRKESVDVYDVMQRVQSKESDVGSRQPDTEMCGGLGHKSEDSEDLHVAADDTEDMYEQVQTTQGDRFNEEVSAVLRDGPDQHVQDIVSGRSSVVDTEGNKDGAEQQGAADTCTTGGVTKVTPCVGDV